MVMMWIGMEVIHSFTPLTFSEDNPSAKALFWILGLLVKNKNDSI